MTIFKHYVTITGHAHLHWSLGFEYKSAAFLFSCDKKSEAALKAKQTQKEEHGPPLIMMSPGCFK